MKLSILTAACAALCIAAPAAQAAIIHYGAVLTGAAEIPANASPATGYAFADYDDVAHTLHLVVSFDGLLSGNTAAHIHCCQTNPAANAGVATTTPTFAGFPTGATSGLFDTTLDLLAASSYRAGFITANGGTAASAELALMTGMALGQTYFNIHTTGFPGGEIRGVFHVPEPTSLALVALAVAGLGGLGGRARRTAG